MNQGTDLKMALRDAINCSFVTCVTDEERVAVANTIVEFFTAIGMKDSEYLEILSDCGGMDFDADEMIDQLIAEYTK